LTLAFPFYHILFLSFCNRKEGLNANERIAAVIKTKCNELGPMTFREKMVLILFVSLVLLWFFRSPGFFKSYGDLIAIDENGKPGMITNYNQVLHQTRK